MPFPHSRTVPTVALALCASAALLGAQQPATGSVTLSGRALGTETRAPLSDVLVRVQGTRLGAMTDADGAFRIGGLSSGTWVIVAQRVGLATVTDTLAIGDTAASVTLDLRMAPAATVLAPTVVSASRERQRRTEASATIDVLDGAELRRSGAAHPNEVMNRLPGVHVIELSGEGHMTAIRQPITTKPVYLYLEDGVPTRATGFFNHNALYEVNVPQAGGIEVLKGPGTALYGSDAIGGVINVLTRPASLSPTAELSAEGGAYGWGRVLASGANTWGRDGVRADLNLTRTDGWRDASAYHREIGTVRWDHTVAEGWSAKTVVTASAIRQNDVYTVTDSQFTARSPINRSPIAYRDVQAARWSTALDHGSGQTLWSFTPYARHDVLDLMPYWQLSYDPQLWDTRNNSLGMLAKYRRDFEPLSAQLIAGTDVDWSPGSFRATQVLPTKTGTGATQVYSNYTLGATQYDYDVTWRSVSPYAQFEATVLPHVRIDAGVRYDVSGYDYANHLGVDESAAQKHRRPGDTTLTFRHLSPKAGVTWELAREVNFFASYRHGFRAPAQGQLFQQNTADNTVSLRPVKVDSYETGVRGELRGRVLYELSAYDMLMTDDILTFITAQNTREAVNAGKSRYRGLEGALGVALTPRLRLDASWSVSDQRYVDYLPQAAQPASAATPAKPEVRYSGDLVEQAPREMGNVMLAWSPKLLAGGRISAEWNHTGRYAEDAANTRYYAGYDVATVQLNAFVTRDAEVFARVTNLFDRTYAELVSYDPFQKSQYSPGSPRTIYAGLRYRWGK